MFLRSSPCCPAAGTLRPKRLSPSPGPNSPAPALPTPGRSPPPPCQASGLAASGAASGEGPPAPPGRPTTAVGMQPLRSAWAACCHVRGQGSPWPGGSTLRPPPLRALRPPPSAPARPAPRCSAPPPEGTLCGEWSQLLTGVRKDQSERAAAPTASQ